jgi:hypothetical protein
MTPEQLKQAGFSDTEIKAHFGQAQKAPFMERHPNLYGVGGAVKETAKKLSKVAWLKYIYPEEREKFLKLDKQHQVRDLLYQDLEFATLAQFKPLVQGAKNIIAPTLERFLPKTYKLLTKRIGIGAAEAPFKVAESEVAAVAEKPTTPKISGAEKVEVMYNRTLEARKQLGKTSPKKIMDAFKAKWVDVSGNVKRDLLKHGDLGKKAVIQHDLIAGATPKAIHDYEALVEPIFGGLKPVEQEYLNRVIQSRRTIAIETYKDIKHPEGLGMAEHQEWLDSLPKELSQKLNQRADEYFKAMKGQLDALAQEGLITTEAYEALIKGGDYSPRNFMHHIDPERTFEVGGRKISVPDSGIKKLTEGSEQLLLNDSNALLQQVITRTQNRIFRNRANQAMYDIAEQIPDNGVVKAAKVVGKTKTGAPIYESAPVGHESIKTVINGQVKEMFMPKELATEWVMRNPEVAPELANMLGWVSGSKILKPMATGLNPEFFLSNLPRDIAHIWLTTQEYSSVAPKAGLQMAKDFSKTIGDSVFRKGAFKDYISEGGGMELLTHQGKITSSAKGVLSGIQKVLGWFGETSEIATRLMLRERALQNGKSPVEATWIARNYLDFSQGGSSAKAVDTVIPYFSAAIQGIRGVFRAGIQKPGVTAFKVAQIGTIATGLYMANRTQNPDAWNQISDRDKVNNWIITTPFSYKDKDGTKKYVYFKIAKDQGQRVFATGFENLMAKYMGDEVNPDQISQAVQEALPIVPTGLLPPTLDAMIGYIANKDFWRNEDIWKGPEVNPQEEYTRYTHPGFVGAGKLSGMSPEKLKYALSQYFTQGNIYTSVVGYGWNKILNEGSDADRELTTEEIVLKQPFVRRVAKSTDPLNQYRKSIKDINRETSTERYMISRTFDGISQKVYDGKLTKKDLKTFINSMPATERERLWKRHIRTGTLQGLEDKRWWLEVWGMDNPEAKALAYWNKWRASSPEKKKEMDDRVKKLPWIRGGKFFLKLKQLKDREKE